MRMHDVTNCPYLYKKSRTKNIIIESHFAHDIPNDLTVVLRCSPKELRERLEKKNWSAEKIEENIQAEIREVCLSEALEMRRNVLAVGTAGKSPEQVAGVVVSRAGL